MLVASIPAKFSIPWAKSAGGSYINAIPTASQIGIIAGAASLTDGFPPTTMQPGGTPPAGPDFNGILKWVTQWAQWQSAGGPIAYDATFQTAIGGYPLGASVASATTFGTFWFNLVDGNTSNPDTGGANWQKFSLYNSAGAIVPFLSSTTFIVPAGVYLIKDIKVWGAGGGGGGTSSPTGAGAGGGSGQYSEASNIAVTPGQLITITIGSGGAAGAATPTSGTAGGASSFGSYCSAGGGAGGLGSSGVATTGVAGGSGGTGALTINGNNGGTAIGPLQTGLYVSGAGGGAPFVGSSSSGNQGAGSAGNFPGGGGNGGAGSGTGQPGGAGAPGFIVITY